MISAEDKIKILYEESLIEVRQSIKTLKDVAIDIKKTAAAVEQSKSAIPAAIEKAIAPLLEALSNTQHSSSDMWSLNNGQKKERSFFKSLFGSSGDKNKTTAEPDPSDIHRLGKIFHRDAKFIYKLENGAFYIAAYDVLVRKKTVVASSVLHGMPSWELEDVVTKLKNIAAERLDGTR